MDFNTSWYFDKKIERTKKALEKNNYEVYVVNNVDEMKEKVLELIQDKSTVSFGGSMTLVNSGILDELRKKDIKLLDRYKEGLTGDEIANLYRETFFADYYITSSNAVTENGELVNLDGNGNRVAAMIFGPKKVIVIVGQNKLVKDLEEAYDRVRNYASPINAKRLNRRTPCCETGYCLDCNSNDRICNHYVVTYRQNVKGRGIVIIVKDELGY
ncbi:lactate utilization protein [Thermobrachium celere]|uniref:Uncharacterized protein, ortholog of Thermotoga (4980645) n=1 Tax=Thermobrachium celere DSM 8682 TaxID=941824 RepID=R7RPM2_9CLOT|nr:lactate utilization protein [Thermobrachium celere]CDF58132.1 Uncharacterized protein, ortholog of Thermotoga (4980645) [Thermobrachium celere DSM 8682]